MKKKITKKLKRRKQRIQYRLRDITWKEQAKPMFSASNIHYDIADRTRGLAYGGIGGIQLLARQTGLVKAIDDKLKLLKRHLPYFESDQRLSHFPLKFNKLAHSLRHLLSGVNFSFQGIQQMRQVFVSSYPTEGLFGFQQHRTHPTPDHLRATPAFNVPA